MSQDARGASATVATEQMATSTGSRHGEHVQKLCIECENGVTWSERCEHVNTRGAGFDGGGRAGSRNICRRSPRLHRGLLDCVRSRSVPSDAWTVEYIMVPDKVRVIEERTLRTICARCCSNDCGTARGRSTRTRL